MAKNPLEKHLKAYAARYRLLRFWNYLQFTAFIACALIACYVLVDKIVYVDLDTSFAVTIVGLTCSAAMLIVFLGLGRRTDELCYLIDKKANLKNLISSSLEVEQDQSPVARHLIAKADHELKRRTPSDLMPMRLNWGGKYCLMPLVAFLAISQFMPHQDFFKRKQRADINKAEAAKRKKSAKLLSQTVKKLEEVKKDVKSIDGKSITQDMNTLAKDLQDAPSRKEALSKLNSMEKRYKQEFNRQRNFEKATRNLEARLESHDLKQVSRDQLKDLAKSMRKNDFKGAADAMRRLAEQMAGNELDQKQKQALARELKKMMDQMQGDQDAEKLSKALNQMQNKDKPQQNKQANQQNPKQSNPQQNQAQNQNQKANPNGQKNQNQQGNQQQAGNQQSQNNQQNNSGIPNSKMGNPGQQPGDQKQGNQSAGNQQGQQQQNNQNGQSAADKMNEMADSLEQMDSLQKMQEGLANAKREMVGDEFKDFNMDDVDKFLGSEGDCPSCGKPGCQGGGQCPGNMPGNGNGGPGGGQGQGKGGVMPEKMTKTGTKDSFAPSKDGKGRILSQKWVYGVPEKGDARKSYSAEVRNAREKAMSSLARNPVPQEYKDMVKDYFSSLEPEKERTDK